MSRTPTSILPLTCYFMAAMVVSLEFLPRDALAIFGEKLPGHAYLLTLTVAGVFAGVGAILHFYLYRRNPERFDQRVFWRVVVLMGVTMAGFFVLSSTLSRSTGLPSEVLQQHVQTTLHWAGFIVLVLVLLLVAGLIGGIFFVLRFHPANRMARKLAAEDFAGAVTIGEKHFRKSHDFTTGVNLVQAYCLAGQKGQARELLQELEKTEGVPQYYTAETFNQTLSDLRRSIGESAT